MSQADINVAAFLAMIAHAEGTDKASDPYRCCYSYKHTIVSLADHPALTGEWRGERMSEEHCKAAGYLSGKCVSTAAGRYQFNRPTWLDARAALRRKGVHLTSFRPEHQDQAAVWLIDHLKALDDVKAGRIVEAMDKCKSRWASLPGAGKGQPERKSVDLLRYYKSKGGELAQ